jgi:hypothetical protein
MVMRRGEEMLDWGKRGKNKRRRKKQKERTEKRYKIL